MNAVIQDKTTQTATETDESKLPTSKQSKGEAEGISSNHPFIDGNKRTAFTATGLFLEVNGYQLDVEKDNEQKILFLMLAEGKVSRAELAEWYRQNTQAFVSD